MKTHLEYEDLALYATGATDDGESERIRLHLDACVACRNELQRVYGDLGMLAMSAPEEFPSPALKARLMRSITDEQAAAKSRVTTRVSLARWAWAAVAAMLALAVLSGWLWTRNAALRAEVIEVRNRLAEQERQSASVRAIAATLTAQDALRITLVKAGSKPQPQVQTIYSATERRVVLVASNLAPLSAGKAYELWVLPTAGSPAPAGVFHPDASGNAEHSYEFANALEAKGFAITVESDAGVNAPTTQPIFVGLRP